MESADVLYLTQTTLYLVLMLSMPAIVAATAVGLVIAILQTIFQVQEQTLSFAAKLIAVVILFFVSGTQMASDLSLFTTQIFEGFPETTR